MALGRSRLFIILTIIIVAALEAGLTLGSEEILFYTQQPHSFANNLSLVVEDVDPRAGVAWIKLHCENETIKSAILSPGEVLTYQNLSLTVRKIYVGGERDLVAVEINTSQEAGSSAKPQQSSIPASHSEIKKSPAFGFMAAAIAIIGRALLKRK